MQRASEGQYTYVMDYTNYEDMKKYNPNFSEEQIKGKSDGEIRRMFKDYYAKHLPVDLLTWMRVYEPTNDMYFKQGYWDQTVFVRDEINTIFHPGYNEQKENPVLVISTHRSKSVDLPVYYLFVKKYNTKIIMRYNFHNWMVSVDSEYNIDGIGELLYEEKEPVNSIYCEGFAEEQVYGMYKDNHKRFTVELGCSFYKLYTFFYMLNKSLAQRNK